MGFDDLISFGIIVTLIIVAGLRKAWEQRKLDQQRQEKRRTSVETLPEATRRQIYGDQKQIPMARPRGYVETREPVEGEGIPAARPRQEERPTPKPRPRPQQAQPAQAQRQPPPIQGQPVARPAQRAAAPPARPRQVRQAIEDEEGPKKTPKQIQQALKALEARKRSVAAQKQAQSARPPRVIAGVQMRTAHQAPVSSESYSGFFSNLDDVRRGIVLSEILSPPVSMR